MGCSESNKCSEYLEREDGGGVGTSHNEPGKLQGWSNMECDLMGTYAILVLEATVATVIAAMSHHVSIGAQIFLLIIAVDF